MRSQKQQSIEVNIMVSRVLSAGSGGSGSAVGSPGDQLHAPAQVVAQVHHADLIFVANLPNAPVINASE